MATKISVYVESREVGQAFGCIGIVRRVGSRRKLAEASTLRPCGFDAAAREDAARLARERGWTVVEVAS